MNTQSESINEIGKALLELKLPNPVKNKTVHVKSERTGKTFDYNFAPLTEIMGGIREKLNSAGILLYQAVEAGAEGTSTLVTRLTHLKSGQWIGSTYPIPKPLDPQQMGAMVTYARRYSLSPLLAIVADDDSDGNGFEEQREADMEKRRAEADAKLEQMKKEGRITSAHTGDKVKPGEDEFGNKKELPPVDKDPLEGIDLRLAKLMVADKVTPDELQAATTPSLFPAPGKAPKDFPAELVGKMVMSVNWSKVIAAITKKRSK